MIIRSHVRSLVRGVSLSPIAGEGAGGAPAREIAFLSSAVDASDGTTYTFASRALGAADSTRRIIVGVYAKNTSGDGKQVSSLTVGGVSATRVVGQTAGLGENRSEIWIADVPTGTTGNIVVTWSHTLTRCGIGIWRMVGGVSAPVAYWTGGNDVDNTNILVSIPPNGTLVAVSGLNAGTSATWTNATERFDEAVESTVVHSGADLLSAAGSAYLPLKVDWSGAGTGPATVAAVWGQDNSSDAYRYQGGVWSWFGARRGIVIGGELIMGGINSKGQVVVLREGVAPVVLNSTVGTDDHNNPAYLRRSSDGRIIAHYTGHNIASYYQRISTNPDDMSSWGSETNLDASLGASNYTYTNLVQITDGIFTFIRCISTGDYAPHYSVSTDNGATWSAVVKLMDGLRPYFRVFKSGANRIDIIANDGHPNEFTGNSTYHFYYDAGAWKATDGTTLGSLPYTPATHLTKIYDGASVESWVHDVSFDTTAGVPVAVFATFPTPASDHRYRYAKWSGSAWNHYEICTAGGPLYSGETYYSGGICIDPDNPNIIYCSREDGSGIYQIWKGVTADGGATWTLTQLTFETVHWCFRPNKEAGSSQITFCKGSYTSFTDFNTHIEWLDV